MSTLHVCVCDCTAGYKTDSLFIPFNQDNKNTDSILTEIEKQIGTSESELDVVYCGQKLERGTALETFSLTPQSTLFAFRKSPPAQLSKDASSPQKAIEMMPLVIKALQLPNYKKTVDQIMTTSGSLQKLLNAVPGLDKDPTAMSMLQDPELLLLLTHRSNIHKVLKHHPLFGPAAVYVAKLVEKDHTRDPTRTARSNTYSLDQMSDEEEDGNQPRGAAAPQQITASQVAAALAAATASAAATQPSTSASATSQGTAGGSGGATGGILPDFFQQSMLQARNAALEADLQQMRDMGITDEVMARNALAASNGNLQAALERIFGETL